MNRKLSRTILIITLIVLVSYIGGIFVTAITIPSFQTYNTLNPNLNDDEMNQANSQDNSKRGVMNIGQDEGCCGHTDVTPPRVSIASPPGWNSAYNNSVNLEGTIIPLSITDDNPMDDYLPTFVNHCWDAQIETSLPSPYEVVLPNGKGPHVLNVTVGDSSGNWDSVIFQFTVGIPPPAIVLTSPRNNTVILNDTIINLNVEDELNGINQALYYWNEAQSNTTLDSPYDVVLPIDNGSCILNVFAENGAGNWTSAVFNFTATTDPSEVTPSSTNTGPPRRTQGFLALPVVLVLFSLVPIITWKRRKKEI
ncbi:MAG: hypothetical protein ACFFAJ_08795 [Candidatus Hodarchaeota archaeon]